MKVIECQMFESYSGTGIAVLTSAFRFFLVNNVDEPKLWRAAEITGRLVMSPSKPIAGVKGVSFQERRLPNRTVGP